MRELEIIFENSPWFILLCVVAGLVYAVLLYQKKSPWGRNLNLLLGSVRFVLVFLICLLLLGPYIKQLKNFIEEPTIIFAIDNSRSITESADSASIKDTMVRLDQIVNKLRNNAHNPAIYTFGNKATENITDIDFDHNTTHLSALMSEIQTDYEGRKIGGVVLLTDGIYNLGASPVFRNYSFNVFPVGVGDTLPKSDINLKALYYNKIAYQGNKFPVIAEMINNGFEGSKAVVEILQGDQVIERKNITLEATEQIQRVEFLIDAKNQGMQHYVVRVEQFPDEYTFENNQQHAFIDIIEGKQKILLVASSPHPDIKAIRSALESNQNYELEVYIPNISTNEAQILTGNEQAFDLVIYHQLPDRNNSATNVIAHFRRLNTPSWFIAGNQTDFNRLQNLEPSINVSNMSNQKDHVSPVMNGNFSRFQVNEKAPSVLSAFPPVSIPFARWELSGAAEVILHQRVGNIATERPLLAVIEENNNKSAIFLGEGLWRWRLQEYVKNGNHDIFDELVSKLTQYLSSKEDKRKFRVYPLQNQYYENEQVVFETEVYDDIFERIYGQEVELVITDEQNQNQSFTYVTNPNNSRYRISGLEQGIYKYKATSSINREKVTSEGEFTVQRLQLESIDLMANFDMLKSLARQTNGKFYLANQLDDLEDELLNREMQGVIHSSEEFLPIIDMGWIFFLLLTLISIEWFSRRYNNSY